MTSKSWPIRIKPWQHQEQTRSFGEQSRLIYDMSDPGTGKTTSHLLILNDDYARGENGRTLIICPKTLMRSAWGNEIDNYFPGLSYSLADAAHREEAFAVDSSVVITNTDAVTTLVKQPKMLRGFTKLIIDECFVGSTLVDTPHGPRAIDTLCVNDVVYTSAGVQRVRRTMRRMSSDIVRVELEDGNSFECTATHPCATDHGWREAGTLTGMFVVRLNVHQHDEPRAGILQQELFSSSDVDAENTITTRSYKRKDRTKITWPTVMEQGRPLARGVQAALKREGKSRWTRAVHTWWEWAHSALRTVSTRHAAETLGMGVYDTYEAAEGQRISLRLQGRLRKPEDNDSAGSGRRFARIAQTLGCEENRIAGVTRVARVTRIECDSPVEVFNLEVDGPHDYSVAGVLVHNCTTYKHATSQRSKAMRMLSKQFERRSLLTGTPNPNSVTELWHQILLLDEGKRLGTSFFHFRNSVQQSEQSGPMPNMVKWTDKVGAAGAVFSLIQDISIRHAFEDVMTHVPPNHVSRYEFELNKKTQKIYDTFASEMVARIGDEKVTAVHASSLRQKLLQIASGAVYNGGEERSYALVDTQRYELAAELIEQYKHSVVFFNWFHQREEMSKLLYKRGIPFAMIDGSVNDRARGQIVDEFQSGKYQTILLHPRTGAHGLTLTRGEACIILSPFYEADLLKQAIHRIYRGTQDKVTNTILVQAQNTVEGLVYNRLDTKTLNMNDFLELVVASQRRSKR